MEMPARLCCSRRASRGTTGSMEPVAPLTLGGRHVRLEPLASTHLDGLQAVIEGPRDTFGLTPVPRTRTELEAYVATALEDQKRTVALPFATFDAQTGRVLGTTRFGNIEFWPVPPGSTVALRPPGVPYAVEDWLDLARAGRPAHRRQHRGQAAHARARLRALGGLPGHPQDGRAERPVTQRHRAHRLHARRQVIRAHSPASDGGPRDAAIYSMLAREWPDARARLDARLARGSGAAT